MRDKITISIPGAGKDVYYLSPGGEGKSEKSIARLQKQYEWLKNFIKPDATIIDVGARDGDSLIPILPILKEGSRIIAFEPEKTEFDFLVQNLDMVNTLRGQVYYNNFAIGKKTELRDFLWDTQARNGGFKTDNILASVTGDKGEEIRASTCKWDKEFQVQSFCWNDLDEELKNKMLKASYIKTDTEGSDIEVLNELLPVINKTRPYIMMEWFPFTEQEITEFVDANDYVVINPQYREIMYGLDLKNSWTQDLFLTPQETLKEQKCETCGHMLMSFTPRQVHTESETHERHKVPLDRKSVV